MPQPKIHSLQSLRSGERVKIKTESGLEWYGSFRRLSFDPKAGIFEAAEFEVNKSPLVIFTSELSAGRFEIERA